MKLSIILFIIFIVPISLLAGSLTGNGFCQTPYTGFAGLGSTLVVATASAYQTGGPDTCTDGIIEELQTLGPIRPGFFAFSVTGTMDAAPFGGVTAELDLNGTALAICDVMGCVRSGNIPFMLGTPFEIKTLVRSNTSSLNGESGGVIYSTLHVYELVPTHPGSNFLTQMDSPILVAAPTPPAPEPGTIALTVSGIAVAALIRSAKNRRRTALSNFVVKTA